MNLTHLTDTELVVLTRAGHPTAYAVLFERHRAQAARVAARHVRASEVADAVAEAFTTMLALLRAGRGPTDDPRAYLLTSVRHEAVRRSRRQRRLVLCDDMEPHVPLEAGDPLEHDELASAYRSLPLRWRRVLWQLEVEGRTPRELAPELGLSPNAVSALGCRARAGLRLAMSDREAA